MFGTNKWLVLVATIFGVFMSALDGTIVTIALPKLEAVFGADVHTIQWVITGYTLALGVSIPISGWAADRYGIKRVYLISLALFTLGSVLCGLSFNTGSIIFFRVLQGLGGGPLQPLSLALLFATFPPEERGLANGVFGIPVLFAPALGPTLGGYIVQHLSWPIIFFVNVPVGIVGFTLSALWLRDFVARPGARFDLTGFILVGLGLVLVLYALGNGAYDGWGSFHILASIVVGVLLLVAFVFLELRQSDPLLDLRLFGQGPFLVASLVLWLTFAGLFGVFFLLPLFLENLRGLQPFDTGKLLLWQAGITFFVTPISGFLSDRIGPRIPLAVGLTLLALTSWQLGWLCTTTSGYDLFIVPLILRGIGLGLTIAPAFTAALGVVREDALPRASALVNVTTQVVASLIVAVLVTVLQQNPLQHQARLAESATANNPGFVTAFNGLVAQFQHGGLSLGAARGEAIGALYGQLVRLAAAEAFRDALLLTAFLTIPGILLALLVRRPPRGAVGEGVAL